MTFAELKAEVFRRLRESSSSPVYWTDDDVADAINEGYAEISDASEWNEQSTTVSLADRRPYYDLRVVIPNALSIGAAFNTTTNRWLKPARYTDFDSMYLRWEERTGSAEWLMMRGLWWLCYWPYSPSDSGTVKQYHTSLPTALSADGDEPGFHAFCHLALVEYALADLWAQDQETSKALQAWQAYLAYEKALSDYVDGRVSVPMVLGHG